MIENNQLYCDICHGSLLGVKWQKTPDGQIICRDCLPKKIARPGVYALIAVGAVVAISIGLAAMKNHSDFVRGRSLAIDKVIVSVANEKARVPIEVSDDLTAGAGIDHTQTYWNVAIAEIVVEARLRGLEITAGQAKDLVSAPEGDVRPMLARMAKESFSLRRTDPAKALDIRTAIYAEYVSALLMELVLSDISEAREREAAYERVGPDFRAALAAIDPVWKRMADDRVRAAKARLSRRLQWDGIAPTDALLSLLIDTFHADVRERTERTLATTGSAAVAR